MGRAIVETVEHRARLQRHVAYRIVLAHEGLDRIDGVEPHQSLKLYLAPEIAAHQVDVTKARNLPRFDAGDHLGSDNALIRIGVLRRGPAAPEPTDHQTRIGMST